MKKEYRVKKNKEIQAIMAEKKTTAGAHFIIYQKENCAENHYRYALSVSKKYGNAAERNLIKRRVRSVIRPLPVKNRLDFFVVIRTNAKSLSFEEIGIELEKLMSRGKILEVTND